MASPVSYFLGWVLLSVLCSVPGRRLHDEVAKRGPRAIVSTRGIRRRAGRNTLEVLTPVHSSGPLHTYDP